MSAFCQQTNQFASSETHSIQTLSLWGNLLTNPKLYMDAKSLTISQNQAMYSETALATVPKSNTSLYYSNQTTRASLWTVVSLRWTAFKARHKTVQNLSIAFHTEIYALCMPIFCHKHTCSRKKSPTYSKFAWSAIAKIALMWNKNFTRYQYTLALSWSIS